MCFLTKQATLIGVRAHGANAFTPWMIMILMPHQRWISRIMRNRASVRMDGKMAEFFTVADVPGTGGTDISSFYTSRRLSCPQVGANK